MRDGVLEHMNSLLFVFKEANDTMLIGTLVECEADLTSVDAGCVARQRPGRGDPASTILAVSTSQKGSLLVTGKTKNNGYVSKLLASWRRKGTLQTDVAVMARLWI
jgi:hypothetical protein